ncbi:MAG TPA: helix-turn-helix transcriptional regulator [Dyadobacter sp.]|jgi:AraC-like DNA-binding protein|nr:helix-turn-helix transcriptional regulator [Dyadobacter sp.]
MVKNEIEELNLTIKRLDLGVVEILEDMTADQRSILETALFQLELQLIDNKKEILTEKIRVAVIEMINHSDTSPTTKYSSYISRKLGYDYTYLANVFSQVNGITIQQFIIICRIERVKKLILDDELNLTEISYLLRYSSVAYLSNQFKRVTGYSPSCYKYQHARKATSQAYYQKHSK